MSLFRQLWLAVISSTIIAFSGSFIVSMLTARHYLEQQLAIKNNDNASALALSMSQMEKDPVTVELQVAALFDSGQYALVRVIDPEGKVIIEKTGSRTAAGVPGWFVSLFPIASQPGQAQVSSGWTQFGTVELVSHNQFAYQELWNGGFKLAIWFVIGGGMVGLLGMQVLRRIQRPLNEVVGQANAICERRFISIPLPGTPELRSLANAMNAMVQRLQAMFAEEAARLELVRREATLDPLTGLANRNYFMNQLHSALSDDDAAETGELFMIRIADLGGINRRLGREATDGLVQQCGKVIHEIAEQNPSAAAARLNGADFALLLPGNNEPQLIANQLLEKLQSVTTAYANEASDTALLASAPYRHGESVGAILARTDTAIATAEGSSGNMAWHRAADGGSQAVTSNADWKKLLAGAIQAGRLRIIEFPVAASSGQLLHIECPLRLQLDGQWLTAGAFMPMAARLSMTAELDLAAARLALDRLAAGADTIAINVAGESIREPAFRNSLHALLAAQPQQAKRLWLEVSEGGAFHNFEAFHAFCDALRPLGCRLGIEHFGRRFSDIGRLHRIGLDYLKVDGSFIRAIDNNPGNQAFIKGLCSIAHNIGLTVIAEGVQRREELALLPELGFDGATGPAVSNIES